MTSLEKTSRPISVLVVEDEGIVAMDLADQLGELGYHVCATADNGAEALEGVERHRPDVILMDVVIKGEMDGIQTALRIAERHPTPVIFLTAFSDNRTVDRAAQVAPYGYLTKPFQPRELRAAVEIALHKSQLEQRLRLSEERFRNAFDFAPIGMALVDLDGVFTQANPACCRILDRTEDELLGSDKWAVTHPADQDNERAWLGQLLAGELNSAQFEKRYRRRSGDHVWTLTSVSLLRRQGEPLCYLYQIHDLTERKEAELQLARLAHYDTLTGLANRARLWEEAELQIKSAKRRQARLALVFMDLDHFKQINDTLGHDAGDALLQEVARRLKLAVRDSDCVARLGGDEFVLVLPDVQSAEHAAVVTSKIRDQFKQPALINDRQIPIGISMGVSLFPDDGLDAKTLLKCADSALYHAKSLGRNNMQFYRAELTELIEHGMRVRLELRHAIDHDEFELYYQPIESLRGTGEIWTEALIRWNHPLRGLLLPEAFIAHAEDSGLILPMGTWVLRAACREAASWPMKDGQPVGVTVNVSFRQFQSGTLVQTVTQALAESGLAPGRLCLEVTEQALVLDIDRNVPMIEALKALGVKVAIDDFGVGYSSLSYVQRFNPSRVKIDRSFIQGVGDAAGDAGSMSTVRAAIAMARSLGISVSAEGVETQSQFGFLQEEGCDLAQGYYFLRPKPASEFLAWLKSSDEDRSGG